MKRRELADAIVRRLFQNGSGEVADRLVLFQERPGERPRDLGGWSDRPAADKVEEELRLAGVGAEGDNDG